MRPRRDKNAARDGQNATKNAVESAQITAILRRVMPDFYFINTPAAHMTRHWSLLQRIQRTNRVLDFHRHAGARLTELTICAYDDIEPGLLSKVCGTLTALDIDIRSALIYTVNGEKLAQTIGEENASSTKSGAPEDDKTRDETPNAEKAAPRAVVLDNLVLSEPILGREHALSERTQDVVRHEMNRVLDGKISVAQLMAQKRRRAFVPLQVQEIAAERREGELLTRLTLRMADSRGVLLRTTAALASMHLNICVAQINTLPDGTTSDIFFLSTQEGTALPHEQIEYLPSRLRTLLHTAPTVGFEG